MKTPRNEIFQLIAKTKDPFDLLTEKRNLSLFNRNIR